MDLLLASVLLVFIILNGMILAFFNSLEGGDCACAADWKKTYLKAYVTAMLVYNVFLLVLVLLDQHQVVFQGVLGAVIGLTVTVAGLLFAVFGFLYIMDLRSKQCKCASGMGRDVLFWWSTLLLLALVLSMFSVSGLHVLSEGEVRKDVVKAVRRGVKSVKSLRK